MYQVSFLKLFCTNYILLHRSCIPYQELHQGMLMQRECNRLFKFSQCFFRSWVGNTFFLLDTITNNMACESCNYFCVWMSCFNSIYSCIDCFRTSILKVVPKLITTIASLFGKFCKASVLCVRTPIAEALMLE